MAKVKGREFTNREKQDFLVSTLNKAVRQRDKGKQEEPLHIRLYYAIMKSKAWLELSCPAKVVYLEFLRVWWDERKDKNHLEVSYSWLEKRQGIKVNAAARAFVELEALGFVEGPIPEKRGGMFGVANIYRLSTRWQALENDQAAMKKARAIIIAYDEKHKRKRPAGDIKRLLEWRRLQAEAAIKIKTAPVQKKAAKRISKRPTLDLEATAASLKQRLQNSRAFMREGD